MRFLGIFLSALLFASGVNAALLPTQTLHFSARTALARQSISILTSGDAAIITESGQTGRFVWSPTDHSADLLTQGSQIGETYVAPDADVTGASGAWVRDNDPALRTTYSASGGIAATNVQAAITELDTEKAPLASPALTGTPTAPTASSVDSSTQLATTAFVQAVFGAVSGGQQMHQTVRVVNTTNVVVATALENGDTLNGLTLATNDRVLLVGQTDAKENGAYGVVASGAASRTLDADTGAELVGGIFPVIGGGSANDLTMWAIATPSPITLGSTNITITQIPVAGAYTAGNGLTLTSNSFAADVADQATAEAGSSSSKLITPQRAQQQRAITFPASRTALKALPTSYGTAYLTEAGRQGVYKWDGTVATTAHQNDPGEDYYVPPSAGVAGAWVKQGIKIIGTTGPPTNPGSFTGTPGIPPFQIVKSDSPLNFDTTTHEAPAIIVQYSTDEDRTGPPAPQVDSYLFRSDVTADGPVTLSSVLPSGGVSSSSWRGGYFGMNKHGDGSANSITLIGGLYEAGAVGYNELGLIGGDGTNLNVWPIANGLPNAGQGGGTVHGVEVIVSDGTGNGPSVSGPLTGTATAGSGTTITLQVGSSAVNDFYNDYAIKLTGGTGSGQYNRIVSYVGATRVATLDSAFSPAPSAGTTYAIYNGHNTYMPNFISRIQRYYGGGRAAHHFFASAEGSSTIAAPPTDILYASPDGIATWETGVDLHLGTFTTSRAIELLEGHQVDWVNSGATRHSQINASTIGNINIAPGGANPQILVGARGTAAAPIITITGDSNTGIYSNAADIIGLTAAGVEGVRVNAGGANPVSLRVNSTLANVTVGAVDGCGAGFRCLRVPN